MGRREVYVKEGLNFYFMLYPPESACAEYRSSLMQVPGVLLSGTPRLTLHLEQPHTNRTVLAWLAEGVDVRLDDRKYRQSSGC